jgi:bacillolysin
MVKILCSVGILMCVVIFSSAALEPSGSKLKRITAPQGQAGALTSSQLQNFTMGRLKTSLFNFVNKVGAQNNKASSSSAFMLSNSILQSPWGTPLQLPSLDVASSKDIKNVTWNVDAGTPRFIELQPSTLQKKSSSAAAMELSARSFIDSHKSLLRISDPSNEFSLQHSTVDHLGMTHLKYSQMYHGIEVWGKEAIVHMDVQGNIVSFTGAYEPTPTSITDLNGTLDQTRAIEFATNDLQAKEGIEPLCPDLQKMFGYHTPIAKRVIWYDENQKPHLVWNIELRSGLAQDWLYFIDANSGMVLNRYNTVCSDGAKTATGSDLNGVTRSFGTYQIGTTYYMMDASQQMFDVANSKIPDNPLGTILTVDIRNNDLSANAQIYYVVSATNQWSDASSVSAQYNAAQIYQYYLRNYQRKSIDDKNMNITSIMHVTENNKAMENAFWNQTVMCYGDGGSFFKPLAGALDVAAHEMTHGVTQYSANLEYQSQSGALNESWSDAFGALVDSTNWTLGELIVKDRISFPTGALRDLQNPHNGGTVGSNAWQPAKMSEYVTQTADNGGVHANSGIPNHAFYLVATSIGRHNAGQIWYRALTVYLTRTSQFIDARIATEKAATDLYGASSTALQAVKSAWDNVEVFSSTGTAPPPTTQVTGNQWILLTSTAQNALYMAKTKIASSSDISVLSQSTVLNRPAVTDASGIILFVDGAHRLKVLYANPSNPQEDYLDTSSVWRGVAAGPGLNSIALISKYQDTAIYYYDFANNISKTFKIVSQSFDGQNTKTALYADAMSFDPTGKYLLFDCYNEVNKSDGSKLSYWNINLLNIQQNNIQNVFPPQSAGIDVGNPSFSKTSPYLFTFDYLDSQKDLDYVMAADFNTGTVATVAGPFSSYSSTIFGYPTYSGDDKTIAYHTTQLSNGTLVEAIQQVPLKDDKIEPNGTSQSYLINATFPCWFVVGTRTTDVQTNSDAIPAAFELAQNYPNPFNPVTKIEYSLPQRTTIKLSVFDMLGKEVSILANGMAEAGKHEIVFNGATLPSGVYFYTLTSSFNSITKKLLLLK